VFNADETKDRIVAWIRDYFGDTTPAVIGISGGKDSSVTAALCVAALGKDRVLGVILPYKEHGDTGIARSLCDTIGIKYVTLDIKHSVDALLAQPGTAGLALNDAARINTPARMRMTALYMVAACVNGRVANTSNLSEDYVGYATKFGDAAGDFSPLSDLTVTEVKAVGYSIGLDASFIEKPPTDGLCGKTDEDNLGFTYNVLDRYIREGVCDDPDIKKEIDRLHGLSRHKFVPMPVFRLSSL
jgi:NAD+ synthase